MARLRRPDCDGDDCDSVVRSAFGRGLGDDGEDWCQHCVQELRGDDGDD